MDLLPFQLDPAWHALQRPRARILIADAVGLGKTLEAGILLSELIRRGRARRILVATSKAMLTQFQKELWGRFAIPLVRLDSVGLQRIRADLPTHHNPFYAVDKAIISIDTLKQNNWFRTHLEHARWDVIVIDEAHNVARRGHQPAQRARIAELLADRCDHLLLLSATPHDGKARSFASLMNMLDPTAIADPDHYGPDDIRGLFFRRFKTDVKAQLDNAIPERRTAEAHATASPPEERAFDTLTSLTFSRLDQQAHGGLLFKTTLEKALFSSPAACLQTIKNRVKRLENHDDDAYAADITALEDLARDVAAITPADFSKYHELVRVIRDTWRWSPKQKDDRLVIFTERRETQTFLAAHLPADLGLAENQLATLDGGMSDVKQQEIVEAFGQASAPVRVLVTTDVASEGLNLHYQCHRLVHFDIPWSLMVFQQRNGRIDRYGQAHPPEILYLFTDSDNDTIRGDTRILQILRDKDDQAHANIGDPSAFMNVYDVDEEEQITAKAIASGTSADAFDASLDSALLDPFALMLAEAESPSAGPAPQATPPSLFASDFDYLRLAVDRLRETDALEATVRPADKLVELTLPPDLERRFRHLPAEVPKSGVLLLTADPHRMQRALDDARREDSAWPEHHYLWANAPVLAWVNDKLRAAFGRHTAPVLVAGDLIAPDDAVVLVSGLLPNRRGQPLVHRWYAARFRAGTLDDLDELPEFLARTHLGAAPLPNAASDTVDLAALAALLPVAIDAVAGQLACDRDAFRKATGQRLADERDRLLSLEDKQLSFIDTLFADKIGARAQTERDQQRERVRKIFKRYGAWVSDAMTVADTPFIEVIAVLARAAQEVRA